MKKWFSAICILAVTLLSVGCGSSFDPSVSSIYIHKNGEITEAVVESFVKDYYSFDEFQSMIEREISTYNQGFDREEISLKSLEMKNDTIYLQLNYADAESYSKYNEVYCFQGSIDDALSEGRSFDMTVKDADYQEYTTTEVTEKTSDPVLVLKSECVVVTEQPIKYVSNNVEILGSHTAEVMPIDDEAEYAYIIY